MMRRGIGGCSALVLLLALAGAVSCSTRKAGNKDELALMREVKLSEPMSPEQLSDMMEKFGQEIGGLMSENIDAIVAQEEKNNKNNDGDARDKLDRIKRANEAVARDAQSRIAAAGRAGTGELAEFSLSDAYSGGKDFFVNKVNVRLQQAGSFIGSQMSSLTTNLTPKLKEKIRNAPKALKRILSWPTFFNFKIKFNKVYQNRMAELYHQMVFLKTQTVTGIHNMKFFFGKTRHLQKTTQYADLTEEEYTEDTGNALGDREDAADGRVQPQQVARLRELKSKHRNIYGGDMEELLAQSKKTSPTEVLKAKKAAKQHRRKKRDSDDELDDDDEEEGPIYSFSAFETKAEAEADDSGLEDEGEDLGGNQEAELVDDFANGFQHVDLEAQMDAELDGDLEMEEEEEDEQEDEDEANFTPIDWSQHRCMPKIENQDNCGFCYALVASTISDFYMCMWNLRDDPDARPRRLSGRFVSDCGRYMYKPEKELLIDGCAGGVIGHAVKFIKEAGSMSFFGYENQRVAAKANFDHDECVLPRPPTLKDWAPLRAEFLQNASMVNVQRDDWETVNLFLHAAGPVILNLRPWKGFKDYAGGIFDELMVVPEQGKIHSVMVVGRDRDEQGRVYYKLRNTHGIAWGERGYFRMSAEALRHYSTLKAILMPTESE